MKYHTGQDKYLVVGNKSLDPALRHVQFLKCECIKWPLKTKILNCPFEQFCAILSFCAEGQIAMSSGPLTNRVKGTMEEATLNSPICKSHNF